MGRLLSEVSERERGRRGIRWSEIASQLESASCAEFRAAGRGLVYTMERRGDEVVGLVYVDGKAGEVVGRSRDGDEVEVLDMMADHLDRMMKLPPGYDEVVERSQVLPPEIEAERRERSAQVEDRVRGRVDEMVERLEALEGRVLSLVGAIETLTGRVSALEGSIEGGRSSGVSGNGSAVSGRRGSSKKSGKKRSGRKKAGSSDGGSSGGIRIGSVVSAPGRDEPSVVTDLGVVDGEAVLYLDGGSDAVPLDEVSPCDAG